MARASSDRQFSDDPRYDDRDSDYLVAPEWNGYAVAVDLKSRLNERQL